MPPYNPGAGFTRTSRWNPRRKHPVTGQVRPHRGDDWGAAKGTPIPSAAAGVVVYRGSMDGYGNTVVVEHTIRGDTVHTLYAHMNVPSPLAVGTTVTAGQTVGTVGNTGVGTGDHLHFEVMPGGTPGQPNLGRGHATVDPDTFDFPEGEGEAAAAGAGPWAWPFPGNRDEPVDEGSYLGIPGGQEGAVPRTDDGYYPIGANSLWHGGIHFDSNSAATLDQERGVRCIYDGEIVAYRVDSEYPQIEFPNGTRAAYSRGFTLIRHKLEIPQGDQGEERPKLVFYSLYMHLLDFKAYQDDSELARPEHWSSADRFRVGERARDRQEATITGEMEGVCGPDGSCDPTTPLGVPLPRPRPQEAG